MKNDPKADRHLRLRAALRENLKRRKAQVKGRPDLSSRAGQGDDPTLDEDTVRDRVPARGRDKPPSQ
jgi:hypothetical protein